MAAAKKPTCAQLAVLAEAASVPEGRSVALTRGGESRAAASCDSNHWGVRFTVGKSWRFKINDAGRKVLANAIQAEVDAAKVGRVKA